METVLIHLNADHATGWNSSSCSHKTEGNYNSFFFRTVAENKCCQIPSYDYFEVAWSLFCIIVSEGNLADGRDSGNNIFSVWWGNVCTYTKFNWKLILKSRLVLKLDTKDLFSRTVQVGFKYKFWLHCHFSFLDFWFLWTTFENLKSAISGKIIFLAN